MRRNSWAHYQKLVTEKLHEHSQKLDNVQSKLTDIQIEIATLKVKSGVWGAMGSVMVIVVLLGVRYLFVR